MFGLFQKIEWSINATILCIRFPFLYPRNRFTGTHWYWYWWREKARHFYNKSVKYEGIIGDEKNPYHRIVSNYYYFILSNIMYWLHDYPFQLFHCIPLYTELDAMPNGWRKAFGIQICKEIRKQLIKEHRLFSYRIMDIKEKWGYLHWYDCGASNKIYSIINKYEDISYKTCIHCGKPAKYLTGGWICPYCSNCFPKNNIPYAELINNKWEYKEDLP